MARPEAQIEEDSSDSNELERSGYLEFQVIDPTGKRKPGEPLVKGHTYTFRF